MGGFYWEDFLGRIFWEGFLGRNYLVEINKELMFLSRFWGTFVSMYLKKEEFLIILKIDLKLHHIDKPTKKLIIDFLISFSGPT